MNNKPKEIQVDKKLGELKIIWMDNHVSIIPLAVLRAACPCAECRGGHSNMHSEPDPEVFQVALEESAHTRIQTIHAVGTYALTPVWEDGHNYGIYTWDYLRALCPCPICRGGMQG